MLRNRLYYLLKPLLPRGVRLILRRWWTIRKRKRVDAVWPIMPGSEKAPSDWKGWPEGKQFGVVLTHDVESQEGVDRVRDLMRMEMELGFRSSFNFIPEGKYSVPPELREELVSNGFEVGVHDFNHDGYLYHSRKGFARKAAGINRALQDWKAVGFRSGFMLNRLDWLHDLEIEYDASTFDTDPFEPQPEGRHTIFPFWVPNPALSNSNGSVPARHRRGGYVELPYTLPQDSTLFLLLGERGPGTWLRKLDWLAQHGGMVLLNSHPDYMEFGNDSSEKRFPARYYREFLETVRSKYSGVHWHALPREVAKHTAEPRMTSSHAPPADSATPSPRSRTLHPAKIWIDLDNTPHIPFFRPIIRELEARGHQVLLTARDAYQVCEMADTYGLHPRVIGRHYGKHRLHKFLGFVYRAGQLMPTARREKPALSLNHGSRSQVLLSNLLGIPSVTVMDYEHSKGVPFARPTWMIVPTYYPENVAGVRADRVRRYSGIKEDVYAPEFQPTPALQQDLGLSGTDVIVTVRPPASEAHYHNPEADVLFGAFMERVCQTPGVQAVLLPRNKRQEAEIRTEHAAWLRDGKVVIPAGIVEGLNLLWHSDLVVSGGGTMNREAAALGIPVYSIFRGRSAAVDRRLQEEGRMILIENTDQVLDKIELKRRDRAAVIDRSPRPALSEIIAHVEEILSIHARAI